MGVCILLQNHVGAVIKDFTSNVEEYFQKRKRSKKKGGSMINVYDKDNKIVARVKENRNLDYWDGHNMTNGGTGLHKGITKLKDGRFVLIHTSQWIGDKDYGEIITKEQAIEEILRAGKEELIEQFGLTDEVEKLENQEIK